MGTSERTPPAFLWLLRGVWLALPLAFGPAIADALEGWSGVQAATGEVLLWSAWATGLAALLTPRPLALTLVRVTGAWVVATALVAAPAGDVGSAAAAVSTAIVASALALTPEVAAWMVNGPAYGGERRFVLRSSWVIAWVLAPVSAITIGAALSAPPLLLADRRWALATVVAATGGPIGALLARSLLALSRRWLVLVPGGIVIHDPLVLANPILLPRHTLSAVTRNEPPDRDDGFTLDLRLGSSGGTLAVELRERMDVPIVRRDRRGIEVPTADRVLVSVTRPGTVLAACRQRGIAA